MNRVFREFPTRRVSKVAAGIALTSVACLAGGASLLLSSPAQAATLIGKADLKMPDGTSIGTVTFTNPKEGDQTIVTADLNVPMQRIQSRTFHGFHVHANNDPANGNGCLADATKPSNTWFTSVDGHMKKDIADQHSNHQGDLTSVYLNRDSTAKLTFTTDRFSASELFDRAVIFHASPDNFGNIPLGTAANQYTANAADATTATGNTGNAGDRLACGVIDVK
jgi:superoxide dismutase, Cu-Zn family